MTLYELHAIEALSGFTLKFSRNSPKAEYMMKVNWDYDYHFQTIYRKGPFCKLVRNKVLFQLYTLIPDQFFFK